MTEFYDGVILECMAFEIETSRGGLEEVQTEV